VLLPIKDLTPGTQSPGAVQQRIVEAAVHLFARQGFSATTTRRIARLADVNEVSLFRYFSTKEELFWAALQSRLTRLRMRKELRNGLTEQANPELVLPLIIELFVQVANYERELIRLLEIGLLELRPSTERVYRKQIGPIFEAINGYLRACIDRGLLRAIDPSVTTIALSTTVLAHQCLYRLFGEVDTPYANSDEAVSAYSRFWLTVLRPEGDNQTNVPVTSPPRRRAVL
jgi:AcrR family transcriptional regulator